MKALIASFLLITPMFLASLSAQGAGPVDLAPLYQMDLQIGPKLFVDYVEFRQIKIESRGHLQIYTLEGTLTVPGNFTVPLNGEMTDELSFRDPAYNELDIKFTIIAKEQGKEFKVNYQGKLKNRGIIVGQALLEDGSALGSFRAVPLVKQE